jgi:outer membrane protein assembly factor BamB
MTTNAPEAADAFDQMALGDIDPNGSRQLGRRSAVCWADETVVAGTHDGTVRCIDPETYEQRWQSECPGSIVSLTEFEDGLLAGTRGRNGAVVCLDSETGARRWSYHTAGDIGEPQQETRFYLPFVVDIITADSRAYAVSRRYERGDDGDRIFESVIYSFEGNGGLSWRHETDASPIALDVDGDRLGVAFNRCPGDDRDGLRILDAAEGDLRWRWDPPGDGQRRVGDLSLVADGVAVTSHADYRGYMLDREGVRWAVDLGCPVECDGETVYTYPNHVHATDSGAVFLTGNTYPDDGRETSARHPTEQTAVGVSTAGEQRWTVDIGGFVHGIDTARDRLFVPVAQHFRDRDPSVHGTVELGVREGECRRDRTEGVVTTVACDENETSGEDEHRVAVIEEPVAYHDENTVRGQYRLRMLSE